MTCDGIKDAAKVRFFILSPATLSPTRGYTAPIVKELDVPQTNDTYCRRFLAFLFPNGSNSKSWDADYEKFVTRMKYGIPSSSAPLHIISSESEVWLVYYTLLETRMGGSPIRNDVPTQEPAVEVKTTILNWYDTKNRKMAAAGAVLGVALAGAGVAAHRHLSQQNRRGFRH